MIKGKSVLLNKRFKDYYPLSLLSVCKKTILALF
jgi:hypothetical protein